MSLQAFSQKSVVGSCCPFFSIPPTYQSSYSDLTAALVAIGISAEELQIWKEVDGIYQADPRKVPTAALLRSVSPSEASELSFFGSEVIHPHTMGEVMRHRIPIRIKNTTNPQGHGTVIEPDDDSPDSPHHPLRGKTRSAFKLHRGKSSADLALAETPKRPTAVTVKRSVILLNLHSNKTTRAHGFLSKVFHILDTHHLSVDLIASSEVHISLALHSERPMVSSSFSPGDRPSTSASSSSAEDANVDPAHANLTDARLRSAVHDLEELGTVDLVADMAIISLVGQKLKNMIGISGKFFRVLGEHQINIEMISQGELSIYLLLFPSFYNLT